MILGKALEQRDSDDITLEETSFTEQEPVPAESSSASTTKAKGKSRKKSEAQASEATAPRAQTKKVKRRSHAATVAPAPAAIAAVVQDAITAVATGQDTTASEAMSRMTLAPLELGSLATADPSSVTPQKHALVYPPSPKTLQELPSTIIDLEALLPKFDTPPIDTVEDDAEDEITLLAMAERPDFEKFILCNVAIIKTHRRSINQHDHAKLWTQLQEREQMLDWYFLHYTRLAKQKGVYRANTEPEVDPIFGPFDGMDVDLSEEPAPLGKQYDFSTISSLQMLNTFIQKGNILNPTTVNLRHCRACLPRRAYSRCDPQRLPQAVPRHSQSAVASCRQRDTLQGAKGRNRAQVRQQLHRCSAQLARAKMLQQRTGSSSQSTKVARVLDQSRSDSVTVVSLLAMTQSPSSTWLLKM